MEDASTGYKVSLSFILASLLFVSSIVIITPLVSYIHKVDEASVRIVILDGLIYRQGEDFPYTGHILDTLENKIIKYDVVNGLKHGEFSITTIEGEISVWGFVEQNKNIGTWKYFYDDGALESTGSFSEDKPQGKWIWYYKNGKVKSEGNYLAGKPEGRWIKFDEQGHTNLIIYYFQGEIVNEVKLDNQGSV